MSAIEVVYARVVFVGRLQLDFGDWTKDNAGRIAVTLGPITWRGYTLEAGFMSDGASTPQFLWWFLPPWGDRSTLAALFHDRACDMQKAGTPILECDTRAKCDRLFRECLGDLGVGVVKRWLAWAGVRLYSVFVERAR